MTRPPFPLAALVCALACAGASADDAPKKLTPAERKELQAKWGELARAGTAALRTGKRAEAAAAAREGLAVARRLYPKDEYPDGHADLAVSLNNVAVVLHDEGKLAEAEALYRESLAVLKRLYPKRDDPEIANGLHNLGDVLREQGKFAEAEKSVRESLAMWQRLFPKRDRPEVAGGLLMLADVLVRQRKFAEAEPLSRDGVEMRRRLFGKKDRFELAHDLRNHGILLGALGRPAEAEPVLKESLEMYARLLKGDHPLVAAGHGHLAGALQDQGKLADAEARSRDALDMSRRLFTGDHPDVARDLHNLGLILFVRGRPADAEPLVKDSLAMRRRLFKGADPGTATCLDTLAHVLEARGKPDPEALLREALEMRRALFPKQDHPAVANSLNNLAGFLKVGGRLAEAERLYREALGMYARLFKGDHPEVASALNNLSAVLDAQGKLTEAERLLRDSVAMRKRLFTGDHPAVAEGLNNLAALLHARGHLAEAETLSRESLAMRRRLFPDRDHPHVANGLNNLGDLLRASGKLLDAERALRDARAMYGRLYPGQDHPDVAACWNNLASVLREQGKPDDAEVLLRDVLDMQRRRFPDQAHPDVARSMCNLGNHLRERERYDKAEPLLADALAMYRKLHPGDHPSVAHGLINLAGLFAERGQLAEAEKPLREALAMYKKLYPGAHPTVAAVTSNLAGLLHERGRAAEAEAVARDSLRTSNRLVAAFAAQRTEGAALTFAESLPLYRDCYLSCARAARADPERVYAEVWASKGVLARVYERRHLAARAAADPRVRDVHSRLAEARRRRAELLLAPEATDPAARKARDATAAALDAAVVGLTAELARLLPDLPRETDAADPERLRAALPDGAAVVDLLRYRHIGHDPARPGRAGLRVAEEYAAFVVTRTGVARVELGDAAKIDGAVAAWREAITGGKDIPAAVPAKVRELVWQPLREHLPAGTTTVYVCPDAALCRVPFAALPGDRPGTILLENFALAAVPHAPFLLDKLRPREPRPGAAGALVVGGVKYDAPPEPGAVAIRGAPLVRPEQKLSWPFLPNTVGEAEGVAAAAGREKLAVARAEGPKATPAAVLAELPKARYAHLATHGFFAAASFRGPFQLDERDYKLTRWGERVGRAANSPLVMTGLVLAGANDPRAPGRGIVTGEQLIDLDLSGLELAVLSACETGLGDVAGGEGVFGLQRAFHYAGATNVVCSLWKVPDQSTAALMNLFYANLWDQNLAPVEALRRAQLELYKNPGRVPELAKGFRGKFEEVQGGAAEVKPAKDGRAHPLLWAAFTLSGPGR